MLKLSIMQNVLAGVKDSRNFDTYVCCNSNYSIDFSVEFFFKWDDDTLKMRFRLVLDVVRNLKKKARIIKFVARKIKAVEALHLISLHFTSSKLFEVAQNFRPIKIKFHKN